MQIIKGKGIRKLPVGIMFLAIMSGAMMAEASDKPLLKSPVGMSREVMSGDFMMQVLGGLAIVLVCVIGLAWMMRRFGRLQSSTNGSLRMIDGMALSPRERIVLVQVGDTQLLLGVAPGRVDALHVLGEPLSTTAGDSTAEPGFAIRLKDALGARQ